MQIGKLNHITMIMIYATRHTMVTVMVTVDAATDTLDSVVVKRSLKKQNLCLDKGYDFPEIEKESINRRYIPHISHRGEEKKGLIKIGYPKRR